jgi:hypothetical protein
MNRRHALVALGSGGLLAAGTVTAMPADNSSAPPDVDCDLNRFPKLTGKLNQLLGSSFGYIPPEAGDSFQLNLKEASQLTALAFDPDRDSYIPLSGPITVESVRYSSNGGHFLSMRLVSRSSDPVRAHHLVTIDVVPGHVWVVIQSHGVVMGVALIDSESDGPFPHRPA